VFNKLYADMEALRESQRRKHEEQKREAEKNGLPSPGFAPDLNGAKQTVQSVGSKAGAYIGSWGTWMGEKRKVGWGRSTSGSQTSTLKKENAVVLPIRPKEKPEGETIPDERPKTQESYEEDLFDAEAADHHVSAPSEVKKVEAHAHNHPSKFHEEMDDVPLDAVPEAAVTLSAEKWEEAAVPKIDTQARSSAVAEAVEAATTTPISP
jgi:hypothetical protein